MIFKEDFVSYLKKKTIYLFQPEMIFLFRIFELKIFYHKIKLIGFYKEYTNIDVSFREICYYLLVFIHDNLHVYTKMVWKVCSVNLRLPTQISEK